MAVIAVIACILCLTTASIVAIEELRALHGRARSDGRAGVIFEDHR